MIPVKRFPWLQSVTALVMASIGGAGWSAPLVWIEGENYTASNFKQFEVSSMGKPELLSGGKWIMRGVQEKEVAQLVPADGVRLTYRVPVEQGGDYDLWGHIGWFRARADFEWRVDKSEWTSAPHDMPTRNLMELGFFCEVSWSKLGAVRLSSGAHTLEVRFPRPEKKARMLMALDCFAFIQGAFTPEGPFRPGQTYDGDQDRAAAQQVFQLPVPEGPLRSEVRLDGLWQVARFDDPNMDENTYQPVPSLPKANEYRLRWMGFRVPGSPWAKPPLVFGHRLIYRTRVDVPAACRGRGFRLHFSGTNWIVSVFVNGRLAGTHRGVWVPWDLDVSRYIEPGKVNELAVAVKGTYYALDAKSLGKGQTLMGMRNRPRSRQKWTRWVAPIYPSTKGDGDGYEYGIVNPVRLVATGPICTEDAFVKPSVAKRRLEVDLTVRNTRDRSTAVQVSCEAVHERTGQVEKRLPTRELTLGPGEVKTISLGADWATPKLWWPKPNPDLYRLRTTLVEGGRPADIHEQTFGFREVTIRGTGIYLNGVRRNLWNWVDVHTRFIQQPEQWAAAWRQEGNRFMRFSHGRKITQALRTREERLDFYDRTGVCGRLCTMIDGMFISYNLGQRTRDAQRKPVLIPNQPVWENFREHMAQVARAYRNHPSVLFYQVENELVYINGMNIYGAYLDRIEELMSEVCEAGRSIDPTRPYTVGGGGDLSGRLEINCPHYPTAAWDEYPENAYTLEHYSTKIQRWPWDRKKPWVVGESLFANELPLGAIAIGDEAFRDTLTAKRGKARFLRMVYGGYRWAGVAGFFPWDNLWNYEDTRKVFSDLYIVPRKQTSRLFAGRRNELLFKVMNDTFSAAPVHFTWSYSAGGKTIASGEREFSIEPGFGQEVTIAIEAPQTDRRLDGILRLKVAQPDAADYEDERTVPVLPQMNASAGSRKLYLLDRHSEVKQFLQQAGCRFIEVRGFDELGPGDGLLLIGRDALTAEEAYGPGLLKFAAQGGRVVCLEQEHPPAGAALPVALRPTTRFGGYAHPQALGTELFADLGKEDLIDWAGEHPTYRNAYQKPPSGARSLVECGSNLALTPLVEVPCGRGVIVLCQLRVAAKLQQEPAAGVLLRNLLSHYGGYAPATGRLAIFSPEDSLLREKAFAVGALAETVESVGAALDDGKFRVALIHATAKNLQALTAVRDRLRAFTNAGGWVLLNGLDRKGLAAFNKLVGFEHMLRPFRIERVTMARRDHPLAATLGNRDVALLSPEPLLHGRYWVSGNTFSNVIDGRDFAPFTIPPKAPADPDEYKPTKDDHDPFNFVNGMLSSDFWRYIQQIWIPEQGAEPLVFRVRRPDVVQTIRIWNNEAYWTIEDLDIIFDGDAKSAVRVRLPDSADMTEVNLPRPISVRHSITLQIRTWRERPLKRPDLRLVGIDNVQFLRPEGPKHAVFLDSAGGLVAFPMGKGGVFLNQLKFMEEEPRPENAAKKLRILSVLLQNMGVGSQAAARVAAPGLNVRYTPVVLQERCTAYLDDRSGKPGWFGRKGENLAEFPRGRQTLADVDYHVVDYATAPIPDCIILGGGRRQPPAIRRLPDRVLGVPVGRKADLLFSLHAAHVGRPIRDDERRRMNDRKRPFALPTVFRYVLHYADGKTAEIPVVLERDIEHWVQNDPRPLERAQLAWVRALPALNGKKAVVYSMQARNPRPQVAIESLDVIADSERATAAVLAVSTGQIVDVGRQ